MLWRRIGVWVRVDFVVFYEMVDIFFSKDGETDDIGGEEVKCFYEFCFNKVFVIISEYFFRFILVVFVFLIIYFIFKNKVFFYFLIFR